MKLLEWIDRQMTVGVRKRASLTQAGQTGHFHVRSKPEYKVIVGGLAENRLRDAVFQQLRPDDVVIEIGAHIGSWSVFLGLLLPQGHLHVFEPVPHNFQKLVANLKLNGLNNVTAYQKAMSQQRGTAQFSLPDNDAPVEGTLTAHNRTGGVMKTFDVELESIDELAATLDRKPTVLKIDCEGAEAMVLRGANKTLDESVRVIFLELHAAPLKEQGEDPEQLVQSLVDRGFAIEQRWPESQHVLLVRPGR